MTEAESMKSWTREIEPYYAASVSMSGPENLTGILIGEVNAYSNKSGRKLLRCDDRWFVPEALTAV